MIYDLSVEEAIKALKKRKKVRCKDWKEDLYIYLNSKNIIIDQNGNYENLGNICDLTDLEEKKWGIIEDKDWRDAFVEFFKGTAIKIEKSTFHSLDRIYDTLLIKKCKNAGTLRRLMKYVLYDNVNFSGFWYGEEGLNFVVFNEYLFRYETAKEFLKNNVCSLKDIKVSLPKWGIKQIDSEDE